MKLRILHSESSLGWGGQELRIVSESEGLRERGHEVRIACSPRSRLFEEAQRRGLEVVPLPIARLGLRGILALRRELRRHPVDVVNTHSSIDSWTVALALGKRRRADAPAVVRTRHLGIAVSTRRSTRWLYQRACDRVVATGERVRKQLIEENGFRPESIVAVPTGIDARHFVPGEAPARRETLGLPREGLLLLFVATLRGGKGLQTALDAFADHDPGAAWTLVVVGDGPMAQVFRDQVVERELEERVRFVGHQDDVLPYLQAGDAYVLPSKVREGVPQALVQAMMCGLPAVTTPMGSIVDVVEDGVTGSLVPPQDPVALAAALKRLSLDDAERHRLAAAGRDHVLLHFDRETMLDAMEALFREVAERP